MDKFFYETWGYEKPISPKSIKSDKTLDDYKSLFESNELKGQKDWLEFYENNKESLLREGFFKSAWQTFKISSKDFFNYVLDREDIKRASEQEHINFIKDNNIKGVIEYNKFKKPKCYYSDTKTLFKHFPDIQYKLGWKSNLTLEDYKKLFENNNLKGITSWYNFYDKNREKLLKEEYIKNPWTGFKISQREFFDYVLGRSIKMDLYVELIKNKIFEYYNLYKKWPTKLSKEISFEDGTKWMSVDSCLRKRHRGFKGDSSLLKLVQELKIEKFGYKDRDSEDYKEIFKDNNLKGKSSWFKFFDKNQEELLNKGYYKQPWSYLKISQKEFFNYVLERN